MRRSPAVLIAAFLAHTVWASPATKPRSHGNAISGTVARVDSGAVLVRESSGHETTLSVTAATHVTGGALKPGVRVAARWLAKDGRKVATSIRVEPPAIASATPAAPPPHSR
jgi:hypothetical protein